MLGKLSIFHAGCNITDERLFAKKVKDTIKLY